MTDIATTYRLGAPEDIPAIVEILDAAGLSWPGASATPYVAVDERGAVGAVYFKTLCFHAEPLAAREGFEFSVSQLAEVMKRSFEALAAEIGPVTVYAMVQNSPRALEAARKNGMTPVEGVLHQITIA